MLGSSRSKPAEASDGAVTARTMGKHGAYTTRGCGPPARRACSIGSRWNADGGTGIGLRLLTADCAGWKRRSNHVRPSAPNATVIGRNRAVHEVRSHGHHLREHADPKRLLARTRRSNHKIRRLARRDRDGIHANPRKEVS